LKKFLSFLAKAIFAVSLAAVILSGVLAAAFNSRALYLYGFQKYDVADTTGLSQTKLNKAASGLISYFNSSEEYIDISVTKDGQTFPLFNEREIIHLKDVKGLFWLDYRILGISLVLVLGYVLWVGLRKPRRWRALASGVLGGSALLLAVMAALGLAAAINFNWLFYQFHYISFANDFWQLDPTRDYLIMLFPGGFWFDAVIYCMIGAAVISAVLVVLAWLYLARSKKQTG